MISSKRTASRPRRWSAAEFELLRRNYADSRADDIARVLRRPLSAVYAKAKIIGLAKSAAFLASVQSGRIQRGRQSPRLIATQFQKGMTPWNKGRKGFTGTQPGCRATQFKPGQKPHTWVPVGSYRVNHGNLEVKVNDLPGRSDVRWHPVHRTIWEAAHGPVPKGCICVFRPGRHTRVLEEITLDRVEVITRAENARRNHPRARNPELGRLIQLKGAITRQVNRIAREAREQQS